MGVDSKDFFGVVTSATLALHPFVCKGSEPILPPIHPESVVGATNGVASVAHTDYRSLCKELSGTAAGETTGRDRSTGETR